MDRKKPLIRPQIQALKAYDAPDDFQGIKLDAMESPWSAIDFDSKLLNDIQHATLNLYPDPYQKILRSAVAKYFSIEPQKLLFGNGSDELIALLMMAVGEAGDTVLSLTPSFSVYQIQAIANQKNFIEVPLNADFSLNLDKTLEQIKKHRPVLTFIAYPNNPTGNSFERKHIEKIIQQSSGLVILDEAYYAFGRDQGFLQDIKTYDNLLVMRTFSKLGFAGLRIGLLAGDEQWLEHINKVRLPYNINTLSQHLLGVALKQPKKFEKKAQIICQQREQLLVNLSTLTSPISITVYPSDTNFILFKVANRQGEAHQLAINIYQQLKQQKVLIRCLSTADGLLNGCLRVSIGTPEQNQTFLQKLTTILQTATAINDGTMGG